MYYFPGENWYALRVRYKHETVAEKALNHKRFSPINLTYQERSRRKDRKKILTKYFFPGYMFIKTTLDAEQHVEVLKSTGVVQIISNSQGPVPIAESQILNVLKLREYTGKILTFTEFCRGMLVRIINGPLTGLIGKIDEVQRNLLKVTIDSIPGAVAIQVTPNQLEPVETDYSLAELLRMNRQVKRGQA
jgi:transcription termination/antitermination protein NusG